MPVFVNGQSISDDRIGREMARLRPEYEQAFADMEPAAREAQLRDWATENLIEHMLIAQEGAKSDIEISAEEVEQGLAEWKKAYEDLSKMLAAMECQDEDQARQHIRDDLKGAGLVNRVGRATRKPTAQEIEAYYQDHKDQFVQSEQVHAAHIVKYVNVGCGEQEADHVMRKAQTALERGVPFELVVSQYSDDPSQGGSLGMIGRGDLAGELEDILFNLGPGQISGIFRTRYGLHVAKVYDRIPPRPLALSQVRGHIEALLGRELSSEAVYAFLDSLKARARIEKG